MHDDGTDGKKDDNQPMTECEPFLKIKKKPAK